MSKKVIRVAILMFVKVELERICISYVMLPNQSTFQYSLLWLTVLTRIQ